jgi:hypothetical protein
VTAPSEPVGATGAGRDLERELRRARAEQLALVEALDEARDDLAACRRALAEALAAPLDAARERDALAVELAALRATATFRYAEPLRALYGRLRGALGR